MRTSQRHLSGVVWSFCEETKLGRLCWWPHEGENGAPIPVRKEATVVKNNRTNENDLREGLAEKARLTKEKVAREELEEKEREDRKGLGDEN